MEPSQYAAMRMLEGDYWWGMPDVQPEPLNLGTGTQQIIDKEIMIVPY